MQIQFSHTYGYNADNYEEGNRFGNMTLRLKDGARYFLAYDTESRLVQIKKDGNVRATYTYNGDGNRVKTVVGSTTTVDIGNYLEWTGSTSSMRRYYYAGGQRVAMREGSSTLYYLLAGHLGSLAITAISGGGSENVGFRAGL